jgi:hypothetical protein
MKIDRIFYELSTKFDVEIVSQKQDRDVHALRIWTDHLTIFDSDTIYFSYGKQKLSPMPDNCVMAVEHQMDIDCLNTNLALISPEHFLSAVNHVLELVQEQPENEFYDQLMMIAESSRRVDSLIDLASQAFGASIVFIDRNFRIICVSRENPVTDKIWMNNIAKGFCDYEFISEVRKLKSVQAFDDSSSLPVEVTCHSSPFRKLAVRVFAGENQVGLLVLIEDNRSYRYEHIAMLKTLSELVGYTIKKYEPEMIYWLNEYQTFLYNLLIGADIQSLPEEYRTASFPDDMQLILCMPQDGVLLPSEKTLVRRIEKILPGATLIQQNNRVLIIGSQSDLVDHPKIISIFPKAEGLRFGISRVFHDISCVKHAFQEALDALMVGNIIAPTEMFYDFSHYSVYVLLQASNNRETLERFLHPAIPILQTLDKAGAPNLLETLTVYLDSGQSIKTTAERMYLHRNSITYRMEKIQEAGALQLENVDTCFQLQLSLRILRLLEKMPHVESNQTDVDAYS